MGIHKTLLANILAAMGSTSVPLTFGLNIYGITGALPASGNAIVTINPVAAPNIILPVITASRTTGVAPLAITFDALQTTAPLLTALTFSEIRYRWRFGDDRGTFWTYGLNVGTFNKNEDIGPVTQHTFETAGNYTVELVATQINNAGQLIQTTVSRSDIVVTNADTVFAGTATICISQNSTPVAGVGGAPAGCAVQQVSNWKAVETLIQTYKRVLLKRGDTWSVTDGINLDQASRTGQGIIGAYGTGNKPVLQLNYDGSTIRTSAICDDWRFMDLVFTANGPGPRPNGRAFILSGSTDTLLLRCEAQGTLYGISADSVQGLYVVDTILGPLEPYVSGPAGYSLYGATSTRVHLMGSSWNGATNHGVRLQGMTLSSVAYNTGGGNNPGIPGAVFTLRGWAPFTGTEWTENVHVHRNSFTGNGNNLAVLSCSPQNNDSTERLRRVILDGNFVSSPGSSPMTCSVVNEFTVRNNIFFTAWGGSVDIRGESNVGSPYPVQNFWYNNTFYSLATGSCTAFDIFGTVSGIVFTNNIAYAPNASSAQFTDGTGGQVTLTGATNSNGTQMRLSLPFVNATPTLPAHFAPANYALGSGAWVPNDINIFGAVNTLPRNMGAI